MSAVVARGIVVVLVPLGIFQDGPCRGFLFRLGTFFSLLLLLLLFLLLFELIVLAFLVFPLVPYQGLVHGSVLGTVFFEELGQSMTKVKDRQEEQQNGEPIVFRFYKGFSQGQFASFVFTQW